MSFRDWVCQLFDNDAIDLNDLDEESYYELEDIYNEEINRK